MGENDYQIIKLLGSGSYGSVYLAKNKRSEFVAIKKFQMQDKQAYLSFKNEIKIFKKINSDYLVSILDYYKDSKYMYLVMEYAREGDLEQYIRSSYKNKKKMDSKFIDTVIYQITEALNVLHKNNIIHRDIKSSNILVFNDNLVKITDFGVSKLLENKNLLANTSIGTPYYMSPELVNGTPYNFSVDFWAFGCLIYKMLTNRYPFEASNMGALFYKIMKGKYNISKVPFKYRNIVSKLLDDKFKRADEKDLYDFILSNSNSFLRIKKPKSSFNLPSVETKSKLEPNILPNNILPNYNILPNNNILPNIRNDEIRNKFNPVYKKLEPIDNKFKYFVTPEKKDSDKGIKRKLPKLDPIKKNKLKEINERYNNNNWNRNIHQNYNVKKNNILDPIQKPVYRKKYKKDFIKINIQNIKKMEQKRNYF
jgi:serine/threonine protein kinase